MLLLSVRPAATQTWIPNGWAAVDLVLREAYHEPHGTTTPVELRRCVSSRFGGLQQPRVPVHRRQLARARPGVPRRGASQAPLPSAALLLYDEPLPPRCARARRGCALEGHARHRQRVQPLVQRDAPPLRASVSLVPKRQVRHDEARTLAESTLARIEAVLGLKRLVQLLLWVPGTEGTRSSDQRTTKAPLRVQPLK